MMYGSDGYGRKPEYETVYSPGYGRGTKGRKALKKAFKWGLEIVLWLIIILGLMGLFAGVAVVLWNYGCACMGLPMLQMTFKAGVSFVAIIMLCVMIVRLVNEVVDRIFG